MVVCHSLWLYQHREIADLCIRHDAFRWLCGGVSVNYHSVSDFRTDNLEFLETLLKQSVERLRQQGLIDLDRVAQDGIRVRASAGAASFRRRETLERLLHEAQTQVQRLKRELTARASDPPAPQEVVTEQESAGPSQQEAAAMRHAEERMERIEQALERLPEMEAKIKPGENKQCVSRQRTRKRR